MGKSKTNHRSREGTKAGVFGLVCNLTLAAAKCAIGLISNSIAVAADGVNNLTDSVSAVLSILGFRLEAVEEDRIHPYGHGRIEYVTGFVISLLILGTGLGVGKEAVKSVLHPEAVSVSALTIGVLALSVAVKLGVMFYCDRKNKVLASPALEAIKKDSLCDACASALTLTGNPHHALQQSAAGRHDGDRYGRVYFSFRRQHFPGESVPSSWGRPEPENGMSAARDSGSVRRD